MKKTERIDCIREIAKSMSSFEWPDIDLIFSQFQLPTSDMWSGDKNGYVIHHLKEAADEPLLELKNYLSPREQEDTPLSNSSEGIWHPGRFRLFLSHVSEDKKVVTEVKERLAAYSIDCFVAHQDIDPTSEWQDVIESGLHSCDALVAFLTKNFHTSNWTDQEIGFCVARRVLVVPLKFEMNPYGFIGKYQAVNCHGLPVSEIVKKIFDILLKSPLTSAKLSEAIVEEFVTSPSWESARARSLLLSKIERWTPELLRKIENSMLANSHIPTAFGVPDKIKTILTKYSQK